MDIFLHVLDSPLQELSCAQLRLAQSVRIEIIYRTRLTVYFPHRLDVSQIKLKLMLFVEMFLFLQSFMAHAIIGLTHVSIVR